MSPEQFAYWLQGFAELQEQPPTAEQWKAIREHLQTVFVKLTPKRETPQPFTPFSPSTRPDPLDYRKNYPIIEC